MDYWTRVQQRLNFLTGKYQDFEFVINGHQLTPAQIDSFKRMTGVVILDPGRYWLDPASGNMGSEGDPAPRMNIFQKYVRQETGVGQQAPRSLSERRQLFNSGDLADIWGAY